MKGARYRNTHLEALFRFHPRERPARGPAAPFVNGKSAFLHTPDLERPLHPDGETAASGCFCEGAAAADALLLHVVEVDFEGPHRDAHLVERDAERADEAEQRHAEDIGREALEADVNQQHGHHAEEEARHAERLHRTGQAQPAAQVLDLRPRHPRGLLPVLLVERTHQLRVGEETVGVGQQDEGDGREKQRRRRECQFFHIEYLETGGRAKVAIFSRQSAARGGESRAAQPFPHPRVLVIPFFIRNFSSTVQPKTREPMKKYLAEMVGTMVLVLMGCGSAVFAGSVASGVGAGVGTIGVALAFGLSVVAMAYTIGNVSGCHINPAITFGVFLSGRMSGREAAAYMVAQVIGAIVGSAILYALTASGSHGGPTATGANSFADGMMLQAFIAEAVFTFIFVLVVLGATDAKQGAGNLAGLAIGLTLVLVHIVCIPITGTSVNPARSIGPALFEGGTALAQLWLFIVAPLVGAALSAGVWRLLADKRSARPAGKRK